MRIVCWNEGDKARDICAPMIIECVEVGYNEDNETVYFRDSEGYEFESIEKVDVNTYKQVICIIHSVIWRALVRMIREVFRERCAMQDGLELVQRKRFCRMSLFVREI